MSESEIEGLLPGHAGGGRSPDGETRRDPVRPDQVIGPDENPSVPMRTLVKDLAFFVPNLVKMMGRLLKDPRVPRRSKLLVGGLIVYLASPIDLIPDFIPVIGMADDLLLAVYGVKHLIDRAGEDVVLEHWDGPQDLLELVRSVLDTVSGMVPAPVRKWIDRLSD